MNTIDKYIFENETPNFRKIHIFGEWWLISVASKGGKCGETDWNLRNRLLYLLSFVFVPVKVVD